MPTCTEESKNSEMPRDDLLDMFEVTKEPNKELKKPIVVRVPKNHPKSRGLYYISSDINLQPENLRGYCYSVVQGKVQRYYLRADYELRKLFMTNLTLSGNPKSELTKDRFVAVTGFPDHGPQKVYKFKLLFTSEDYKE